MADGKIYIIVTDQLPNGGGHLVPDQPNKKDKEGNDLQSYVAHKFFNLIESQAKQAVMFTLQNIGNFTGNYVAQQEVNNALKFVNFGEKLGVAALAGAKFGPVGAGIAAGVVAVGEYFSQAQEWFTGYVENQRQNRQIEMLRSRAGMNSTNNGNRGTEY